MVKMRFRAPAPIAALASVAIAALAGCSSDSISVQNSLHAQQVAVYIQEAAKRGGLRTEITGNPFDVPQEQWTGSVTEAMHGAHFGQKIVFSPTIESDRNTQSRLIIQFQPPATTNYVSLCRDKPLDASLTGEQDTLRARAALCVRGNAIDWAYVEGPMPDSVNDTRLTEFVAALARGVIRPNVADHGGCDNSNCN